MKNEKGVAVLGNTDLDLTLQAGDVPLIISQQFDLIKSLDSKVQVAIKKAEEARKSAEAAKKVSAKRGVFVDHKRAAIEATQGAVADVSIAVDELSKAQKLQFEFQTRLAEITKYLFGLGVTNIAMNRSVVRQLELKLKGAPASSISELAKSEVISVIKQLKAQEDIMMKQEKLEETVKAHSKKLTTQEEVEKRQQELEKAIKEYDKRFASKDIKDSEQDKHISDIEKVNIEQEKKIELQAEKDKNQDVLLSKQIDTDKKHDRQISDINQLNTEQDKKILQLETQLKDLANKYNTLTGKMRIAAMGMILSIIAVAIGIYAIFK